jgi:hypothetical protein
MRQTLPRRIAALEKANAELRESVCAGGVSTHVRLFIWPQLGPKPVEG